jgi:hypothetical protein
MSDFVSNHGFLHKHSFKLVGTWVWEKAKEVRYLWKGELHKFGYNGVIGEDKKFFLSSPLI